MKYSGNLEVRDEENNVSGKRHVILVRNTMGYQMTRAWRLLGKAQLVGFRQQPGGVLRWWLSRSRCRCRISTRR